MTVANRAIKARGKAALDRIQQNIANSNVIKGGEVRSNEFVHLAESEDLSVDSLPSGDISVPLEFWEAHQDLLRDRDTNVAIQLAADQSVTDIAQYLDQFSMIVLPFVNFVDGRAYSHAHLLRSRYQYKGEIRAVGDVHLDQLDFLNRCGIDAFEVTDGEDQLAAIGALTEFSEVYQPAADGKPLIFSRRRTRH